MNTQPNLKPFMIKGYFNMLTGEPVSVELVKHIGLIKNPELLEFVKQNNISEVKKMLDEGCDPNIKDSNKRGCLEFAIDKNNLDMVKLLVAAGANIEEKFYGYYQMSALNYACLMKRKEIVEYLISIGADINNVDRDNDTPLHNACFNTICPEIIRMLLEKGADYTKRDRDGKTLLELVKWRNAHKTVKLIEDFIKSKEEKPVNVEKPSTINSENTVQQSVETPKVAEKIKNPKLLEFVKNNNIFEVKKLLDEGCDPNVTDYNGQSCMHFAICVGNLDMVKFLVISGANIEEKKCGFYQMSALNYACYKKNTEIVEYLISIGADIHSVDDQNDTPFHNAVRDKPCPKIINLLLKNGADYNTKKNRFQNTPLEHAKLFNKKEIVELLEKHIKSKEEKLVKAENPNITTNPAANQETVLNAPKNTNLVHLKLPLGVNSQPIDIQCCYEDAVKLLKEFKQ